MARSVRAPPSEPSSAAADVGAPSASGATDAHLVAPSAEQRPRARKAFRHWDAQRVLLTALQYALIYVTWYLPGVDLEALFRTLAHWFPSPWVFYTVFTIVLFEAAWAIGFGLLGLVYHYDRYFESSKCALSEWPWWRDEATSKSYTSMVKKSADEYVGNQISNIIAIVVGFWWSDADTTWEMWETKFVAVLPLDRTWACGKMLLAFVIFETIFYWTHWFEHKYLYKYHKIHHEYNNTYLPLSITGTYGHAIDGVLGSVLPAVVAIVGLKFDLVTFWQFMVINIWHSCYDHCGYEFTFCPLQLVPFSGWVDAHTFHHTRNVGNYGLYWNFWDEIMGTSAEYKEYVKRETELELCAHVAAAAGDAARKSA